MAGAAKIPRRGVMMELCFGFIWLFLFLMYVLFGQWHDDDIDPNSV